MILKLSDLQRSLDQSLATTHGQSRIFVIVARYCAKAGKLTLPAREVKLTTSLGFRLLRFPIHSSLLQIFHQSYRIMVELHLLDNNPAYSGNGNGHPGPTCQSGPMGQRAQ
jgi:hypothetical protein